MFFFQIHHFVRLRGFWIRLCLALSKSFSSKSSQKLCFCIVLFIYHYYLLPLLAASFFGRSYHFLLPTPRFKKLSILLLKLFQSTHVTRLVKEAVPKLVTKMAKHSNVRARLLSSNSTKMERLATQVCSIDIVMFVF